MPNYCESDLRIEGSNEEIMKLIDKAKGETPLSLNKFIPEPEGVDWYSWRIENWGVKWEIVVCELNDEDIEYDEIEYSFHTAWDAPHPIIAKMSEMFPNLKFIHTFFERGMQFSGIRVYENGKLIKTDDVKYYGKRGG